MRLLFILMYSCILDFEHVLFKPLSKHLFYSNPLHFFFNLVSLHTAPSMGKALKRLKRDPCESEEEFSSDGSDMDATTASLTEFDSGEVYCQL
jgi:hypothetical protein